MSGEKDSLISGVEEALYKLSDKIRFDKLVDQVEKISFGYNPDYTEYSDDYIVVNFDDSDDSIEDYIEFTIDDDVEAEGASDIEAKIVAQLGAYGLRTALDHSEMSWWTYDHLKETDNTTELEREICPDSALRLPLKYNQSPDLEVVRRAEQFGEVLLDKAFACLGPDAAEKAREISAATTEEEQEKVIIWLYNRLAKIVDSDKGIERDQDSFNGNDGLYHPARLSPLAIGKYPNINLAPTCLGVSILAASFFERAGLKHLHAGVMQSRLEAEDLSISSALSDGLATLPEHMQPYILNVAKSVYQRSVEDFGFHAVSVVQLVSGRWVQFDPNFDSITILEQDKMDQKYEDLINFKDVAPGLEVSFSDDRTVSEGIRKEMDLIQNIEYDENTLSRALLDSDEAIESSLREAILPTIKALLFADDHNGAKRTYLEESLDDAFSKCLERLVFWNTPIDTVRERALKDPAFLGRVIEDLKHIWKPTLLITLVTSRDNQRNFLKDISHNQLELGLPAQRIGLAVLNDFDSYLDSELTPNFWLNNWPSQVPRIEAAERFKDFDCLDPTNKYVRSTVANNSAWMMTSALRYSKSDAIINSFLQSEGAQSAESR